MRVTDTLELTCTDPDAALPEYSSTSNAKESMSLIRELESVWKDVGDDENADDDTALPFLHSGCQLIRADNNTAAIKSAVTVYLPEDKSCGYYRLTDGRGYVLNQQAKEFGWNFAYASSPEVRLQGLVKQCELWVRSHLPYNPVRFNLPGLGPMELKINLPGVG